MHEPLRQDLSNDLQSNGDWARQRRWWVANGQKNRDAASHCAERTVRPVTGGWQAWRPTALDGRTAPRPVANQAEGRRQLLIGEMTGDATDVVTHQQACVQKHCKHGKKADLSMPMAQGSRSHRGKRNTVVPTTQALS